MKSLLIALLLLSTPANASTAIWFKSPTWSVVGNTESKFCLGLFAYGNGTDISVIRDNDGWSMMIGGVVAAPGTQYDVAMATDTGSAGVLRGSAIKSGVVVFKSLDASTLKALVMSKVINIQGIGAYDLTGSAEAIKQVLSCYKAMNGVDA